MEKQLFAGIAVTAALLMPIAGQVQLDAGDDPVARAAAKIKSGEVKLDTQAGRLQYLSSVLKLLDVNADSQVLVFSKTSFQAAKISPKTPRAIFFNDTVSVGSVQDSDVFEFIALSPKEGPEFYTLDASAPGTPRFERRDAVCYVCHAVHNGGVPSPFVSSVFPAADGMPFAAGNFFAMIDHRTPVDERWGGWYVTGTHGAQRHRGNAIAPDPYRPGDLETEGTQNLTSLAGKFDTSKYLSGSSDLVALMTLEHQTRATNLIALLSLGTRAALRNGTFAGAGGKRLDAVAEELAEYLLFAKEAPLQEPIRGNTTFTKTFAERGPRDSKGRSLRDFDLQKRMFRYPLSYMIYSEAFDAMPNSARENVYRRLYEVLSGQDTRPKFAHLSTGDRKAILEILRETKPALPADWHASE